MRNPEYGISVERRQQASPAGSGPQRRWYESSFGPAGAANEPYDPRDPYWEPEKDEQYD